MSPSFIFIVIQTCILKFVGIHSFRDSILCRRIILSTLGEPGFSNVDEIICEGVGMSESEEREVGKHAKIVTKLIQWSVKDLTLQQIVTLWRCKKEVPDL